jgi:hypothetical protein
MGTQATIKKKEKLSFNFPWVSITPSWNATNTTTVQNAYLYGDRFKFELVVQLYSHKLFHPYFISQIDIVMKQLVCNKICFNFYAYLVFTFIVNLLLCHWKTWYIYKCNFVKHTLNTNRLNIPLNLTNICL